MGEVTAQLPKWFFELVCHRMIVWSMYKFMLGAGGDEKLLLVERLKERAREREGDEPL